MDRIDLLLAEAEAKISEQTRTAEPSEDSCNTAEAQDKPSLHFETDELIEFGGRSFLQPPLFRKLHFTYLLFVDTP